MTWTKLDDRFYDDPDVEAVGNEAAGAFVRLLAYCGRHLTDGHIPEAKAKAIAARPKVLATLEERDFIVRDDEGWSVRSYLKFNPSRTKVEQERAAARERMAKVRG